MNDLQIFSNPEFGQVRTVEIDGTPWLVGKDVATALGYAKPQNAISRHVDSEDQKVAPIQGTPGGEQEMLIINESGLYSLILSSKMPKAKAFKRWVTSEVLPAIRKHGAYESVKAQQHMEQLEATNAQLNMAIRNVSSAKAALAEVISLRNDFIHHRDNYKARFLQAKTDYGKMCDNLRQAENLVKQAQAELDSRIDQLQIVAFGLPGFDEIMADALVGSSQGTLSGNQDC
jgi:prophage antirepressor-like protein